MGEGPKSDSEERMGELADYELHWVLQDYPDDPRIAELVDGYLACGCDAPAAPPSPPAGDLSTQPDLTTAAGLPVGDLTRAEVARLTLDYPGDSRMAVLAGLYNEYLSWREEEAAAGVPPKSKCGRRRVAQPELVQEIKRLHKDRCSLRQIAGILTRRRIPTPTGRAKWSAGSVRHLLT